MNKKKTFLLITSICLISIFFLIGCEQAKCPEEKAMLSIYFDSWGENIDNEKELIFNLNIFNYGYKEAKNIEITCLIMGENNKKIFSETKNIGNIASTSMVYKEIYFEREAIIKDITTRTGACYISGCDDCEILDERLPEVIDMFYD